MTAGTERPALGSFYTKVVADQFYERGRDLQRQGYWQMALLNYRRACTLDVTNSLFLLARGQVCQEHDLEPEAEQCYAAALRLHPDDAVTLSNLAQLLAARGDLAGARASYQRILDGGIERLRERASTVYNHLGELALREAAYDLAERWFKQVLEVTPEDRYAKASLGAVRRLAEFEHPVSATGQVAPKVALYAYAGAMVLGFPDDDGVHIPPSPALGFESLEELARTLARFVALCRALWPTVGAVLALEPDAVPLVRALAATLGTRSLEPTLEAASEATPEAAPEDTPDPALETRPAVSGAASGPAPDGLVVGVSATGADPAAYAAQIRALRERSAEVVVYSVGLAHPVWEYDPPPQVVSLPVLLEFPWTRPGAPATTPSTLAQISKELARWLATIPPDTTLAAQLAWYHQHRQLSLGHFLDNIPLMRA